MARPLVIGNGRLLICFDDRLAMRDLYYPRVGQVNHVVGQRNQIGIWVDGAFTWVGDEPWRCELQYRPRSLVTESTAVHDRLGLTLTVSDGVHPGETIFIRHVRVQNEAGKEREVRLFAPYDFDIDGSDIGDTALWDPRLGVVCQYKRNRWFLIGASGPEGGIESYATGRKRFQGAEGTWRDAEDGQLEGHPITQGSVDSTICVRASVQAGATIDFYQWVVCGDDYAAVRDGHQRLTGAGPRVWLDQTDRYWRSWAESGTDVEGLPADLQEAYYRSLLIVRTQVDDGGAILAANDSDILAQNRDHYSYMWPRDGAFVAATLDRAGFTRLTEPFYRFCEAGLSEEGFLWHKYNPDGTVGSSWHPWVGPKGLQLPIQEDETALVLWALGAHLKRYRDLQLLGDLFPTLIHPAAEFLLRYRDEISRLPQESYDLWEERRGVFTFTTATVVAGLEAAGTIAEAIGDVEAAVRFRAGAEETRSAMLERLWSKERNCFLRGLYARKDGSVVEDPTLESSVMGLFLLGVLPPNDPRVAATVQKLAEGLRAKTDVGGIARYFDDYYFRVIKDPDVAPGNPWIICTLWVARWHIAQARRKADLEPALQLVHWALSKALPSGVLAEQINPITGEPLSVAPLTWSHAVMLDTLLDLAERLPGLAE